MKLIDKIKEKQIISIEILPPDRGQNLEKIFEVIDQLLVYPIDFISVTRHPPVNSYIETEDRIIKADKIERPGSIGTTVALKNRYKIDVIPHILSSFMDKFQIEDLLIDLNLIGIENLFVVRGDLKKENFIARNGDFNYHQNSAGLVSQIKEMNNGRYLYQSVKTSATDFCIGVAGYPEKHYESPNLYEDLKYLKGKVDSGADFIITQMVFDLKVVKNFIQKLKKLSINVPIIIGIKPIVSLKSIYDLPKRFFINIPENFIKKMQQAKSKEEEFKIGIKYMANYIKKLLELKVDGIHIFTMGKGESTKALLKEIYY